MNINLKIIIDYLLNIRIINIIIHMTSFFSIFKKNEKNLKNQPPQQALKTIDNNKFFVCPKCKQRISIILNPTNLSLSYTCKNNHKETNINFNNFYSEKYISHISELSCQQCKKEKLPSNGIFSCITCQFKLCPDCILKHKFKYNHTNFRVMDNTINKCSKHEIDISQYCKTCQQNLCVFCLKKDGNNNEHGEHEIIDFSEIIPDNGEIEKNNFKFEQKIKKNNAIIDKLKKWKKDMISLIDDIINNLNSEILINKIIIKNFNWKYLDYFNYLNYNNSVQNLEKNIEKLENFMNSKMFIEQTNSITNYLFENDNKIKKDNYSINNIENINIINNIEEPHLNVLEILQDKNAILCGKNNIYSYSIENNELKKIDENFINNSSNNKQIYHNLINLKKSFSNEEDNYNILIWKMDKDLKNDKLFNLISNDKKYNNNKINEAINNKEDNENNKEINEIINNNLNQSKINESESSQLIRDNNYVNDNNNKTNNYDNSSNRFLLFSNSNINFNRDNNNDNYIFGKPCPNSTFDNTLINNNNFNGVNDSQSEEEDDIEEEDEYVYISRTGYKYHGYSTCGRMKTSTRVTLSKAESMGLEPCKKCYY